MDVAYFLGCAALLFVGWPAVVRWLGDESSATLDGYITADPRPGVWGLAAER